MVHAIAKITNTSGLRGEVKLRPLSRYSIDYIMTKDLHIGQIENNLSALKQKLKILLGKLYILILKKMIILISLEKM